MEKIINDEGIDFIPANIELAGLETSLVNVMSREQVTRLYLDGIRDSYDYILIACMLSLGMFTINALVAADRILIPVEAAYLSVKAAETAAEGILTEGKSRILKSNTSYSWHIKNG